MRKLLQLGAFLGFFLFTLQGYAQKGSTAVDPMSASTFSDIKLRNIGPAFMSGRIADIAIHPQNQNIWYVAVASGGVWKTNNSGVSWQPLFDEQPVFATGCVTIDPNNPHIVWVGTGENVGGRHLAFGDGVYRSTNDGQTWQNMGLKKSEHISKIIVKPGNSDVIYVAAQGPLWSSGGDRGFYKTVDGGKTWKKTLGDDQWTGVTDIVLDPRNPNRIYAATWQRHRTVAAYMGGGPETAIYRSEDGGETWNKLSNGLPKGVMGKIGLAVSLQKPDIVYAAIELERRKGAFYKSTNRGESWTRQSDAVAGGTGPHYYQELYASPHQFDRVYLADVRMQVSDDGGKTFRTMKEESKHSDNHALAFRANDPDYLLVGTDGGIYESFDLAEHWRFINNLPLTQFYKIAVDDAAPFYNIYGGTQDNSTQGGPSRTLKRSGIQNSDWEVVLFADGYQPATEPGNPAIVYAEWQEGNLVRADRTTGEIAHIQPQPKEGEPYERFNWDAPILVSSFAPNRIYYASQRVWKSDNRGDAWTPISGDLTQFEERMNMPIMGKEQGWEMPWDLYAMSTYNTITSIAESPKQESLLYAGTDDGLIQVTEDGGTNWRKIPVSTLPGAPDKAFVNDIKADLHDVNTVYACLDNHKYGDYKPYIYKSTNKGKSWTALKANLPDTLLIWRLVQDYVNPKLLFIGTEFGIYFTTDGGGQWVKLNAGANISFRDLAIQKRENDLVGGSFGRGIFILDDYSPLRQLTKSDLNKEALLFNTRKAWWYLESSPIGGGAKGSLGESFFTAPNPPFGAVFTYYLKDDVQTLKDKRMEQEKELQKNKQTVAFPGWNALDKEALQQKPRVYLTILDAGNNVVKEVDGSLKKGMHRVNWDLTFASDNPVRFTSKASEGDEDFGGRSYMVAPGKYKVVLNKEVDGVKSSLSDTLEFDVVPLQKGALPGASPEEVAAFWKEISVFQGKMQALFMVLKETESKANAMQKAVARTDNADAQLTKQIHDFKVDVLKLQYRAFGNPAKGEIGEKQLPTIMDRMQAVVMGTRLSTYGPTPTHKQTFEQAQKDYAGLKQELVKRVEVDLPELEKKLRDAGAPYIQGQGIPD